MNLVVHRIVRYCLVMLPFNSSLPEHIAYQKPEGINALRRVLRAYALKNKKIGNNLIYCLPSQIHGNFRGTYISQKENLKRYLWFNFR